MVFKVHRAMLIGTLLASAGFATTITVNNPSFETLPAGGLPFSCGTGCFFSSGTAIPGWVNGGSSGQFQPGGPSNGAFTTLDDGPTSAYASSGTISQTVGTTVQTGITYTLLVDLGFRNDLPFDATADLLVNGVQYFATGTPVRGTFQQFVATYTGLAGDSGDPITIQLNASGNQGNFDNVRLSSNLNAVPEPVSLSFVGIALLGLGVLNRRRSKS